MRYLKQTLLILSFLFFALAPFEHQVSAQVRSPQKLIETVQKISGDKFSFALKTRRGVRVYAVNKPTVQALAAIDQGLTDLFAIARKHNYRTQLNYADYIVFIARPDRDRDSNGNYSPDIAINAVQYAGSVYDQGGFIYAAGMVVSFEPCAFIIAEHARNLERISEVVRYEGEHLVLYHNDRPLYNKTVDHSRGGGHPILQ